MFRIFLAQQRTASDLAVVTSLLQQWVADEPPEHGLADEVRERPRPAGGGHPAALPGRRRPGPQRPVPLVRPAARGGRAGRRARGRARRARPTWPPIPTRPTTPPASTRSPRSPSRSCASSPSGSSTASPSASRCSRSWPAATTASTSCTTCAPSPSAGRPFVTCDYTLDDRPTRLVTTVAHPRRAGRPAGARRPGRERDRAGRRRAGGSRVGRRPLPALAAGAARRRTRPRPRLAELLVVGCRSRSGYAASPSPCAPAATARSPTSPSVPGRTGSSRTTWSAACTRWSGAGSTCGGCATSGSPGWRRPRTCCSTTAWRRTTRPTSGSWRSPRCASSPSCATQDGHVVVAAARRAGRHQLPGGDPPGPHRTWSRPAPSWT